MTDHTPPEFDRVPTFFSASNANPTPPEPKALGIIILAMIIGWPTFIAAAFGLVSPLVAVAVWAALVVGMVGWALVAK